MLLQENLQERSVVKSKTQMAERFRGELHEAGFSPAELEAAGFSFEEVQSDLADGE